MKIKIVLLTVCLSAFGSISFAQTKKQSINGDENETAFICTDDKGAEKGKFAFRNDEPDGRYLDSSGKEAEVSRIQ